MKACVAIPVLNEQAQLVDHVARVRHAMQDGWRGSFRLVVADNGSTDRTPELARDLARQHPEVDAVRLETRGRGGALRAVWSRSDADVLT
jgi:glycosyltransferase involved in cell wall biosynthesis